MPATVKSLDERTEEIAEDVSALKMRSEDVSEELTALKARTAEIASDVSATKLRTAEIAADVTLIKSQLVELNREFAMSRAKIDSTLGMQRWIGIFAASVLVTVVFSVINGAFSAGKLESSVDQLKDTMRQQDRHAEEQNKILRDLALQLAEMRVKAKAL